MYDCIISVIPLSWPETTLEIWGGGGLNYMYEWALLTKCLLNINLLK